MRFAFDIDTSRYTQAELDLIYDILFSGDMSIIYQELSEKTGFIYGFDARLERYCNRGCLYFSFEIQRKNIIPAIACVVEILNGLKKSNGEELMLVLPEYIQNSEMILDSADDLNWDMAYECHIMNGTHRNIAERRAMYEAVTPERLMTVAQELFIPYNATLTLKTNAKTFDRSEAMRLLQMLQQME